MTVLSTSQEESKRRQTRGPTRRQVPFHPPDDPPSKPPHHDPGAVEADPIVENARHGPLPRSTGLMRTLTHIRPHEPILARKRRVNPSGRSSARIIRACVDGERSRSPGLRNSQSRGSLMRVLPSAGGGAVSRWERTPPTDRRPVARRGTLSSRAGSIFLAAHRHRLLLFDLQSYTVDTMTFNRANSGSGRDPSRVGGPPRWIAERLGCTLNASTDPLPARRVNEASIVTAA